MRFCRPSTLKRLKTEMFIDTKNRSLRKLSKVKTLKKRSIVLVWTGKTELSENTVDTTNHVSPVSRAVRNVWFKNMAAVAGNVAGAVEACM